MDSRRWWLVAAAVPVALGCALATARPALTLVGQLAVVFAGLLAAVLIWCAAPRTGRRHAWRLFVIAPLLPVAGVLLTVAAGQRDPVTIALLRWAPAVPGYLVAVVAVLGLVDRARLRAGGRVAVEIALFFAASTVVVGLLLVGPGDRWSDFHLTEQLVLGSAVLATSAIMAAALTLLGVIEAGRRSMAATLLAGTVFLTLGRGLATSALFAGTPPVPAGVARGLMGGGLLLLGLAVLLDSRPAHAEDRAEPDRGVLLGSLLPHLALLTAVAAAGVVTVSGERQNPATVAGLVCCVVLAAVHRWLSARDEQRLAARLRRSESYFRSVVQSAADAVVILDDDLSVRWASPALDRALGDRSSGLVGHPILQVVHPDDASALDVALRDAGEREGGLLTVRLPDAAGEWRYLEASISDLRDAPDVGALVLHCRDMTDRHAREQALQSVAYTDPMTGLPNRAGFHQLVRAAVAAREQPTTLLMLELDGLAAAREATGRETVSAAVAEVGRRLRATVRGEDAVARLGGGAFAVLAGGSDADVDRLAARCLAAVEQPIVTAGGLIELTSGVGLVAVEAGLGVEELLARAELAVRAAHDAGLGTARRYQDSLGEAAARRERLRRDLQGARAREELFLLFQPIVSLGTQQITGMEAQLHWRHAELGEIPPAEFLLLAERAGLIGELLRWAIEETTSAAMALPERDEPLRIGLKVPFAYLETGALVPDVEQALRRSGLAPGRLVIKINAPAVMSDDERTGLDVDTLRLLGVHVALDGFGSGSSALAHLTRLPIDIVTLDRSLITRIDRDPQSLALCESIIGIATALGLDVVATGVETAAQLAALRGFGCGYAQGFLLSRPVPFAALLALLSADAGALWPGLVGSR